MFGPWGCSQAVNKSFPRGNFGIHFCPYNSSPDIRFVFTKQTSNSRLLLSPSSSCLHQSSLNSWIQTLSNQIHNTTSVWRTFSQRRDAAAPPHHQVLQTLKQARRRHPSHPHRSYAQSCDALQLEPNQRVGLEIHMRGDQDNAKGYCTSKAIHKRLPVPGPLETSNPLTKRQMDVLSINMPTPRFGCKRVPTEPPILTVEDDCWWCAHTDEEGNAGGGPLWLPTREA